MITQHYLQCYAMADWYKLLVAQRNEWWWVIQPSMKREQVYNCLFLLLLLFCKKVRRWYTLVFDFVYRVDICWSYEWRLFVVGKRLFVWNEYKWVLVVRQWLQKTKQKNENTPTTKTTTINKTSITGTITTATTRRRSKRNEKVTKVHRCNDVCNDLFYWIC